MDLFDFNRNEETAKPFRIRIEGPIDTGDREGTMQLEKVLTDIHSIKPGMDIKDQKAIQEQKSSDGIIAAVVVGIGIATYFLIRIMSL